MKSAMTLEGIYKRLNGRDILKNVSFSVEPGDIFGFLGPNGAGKTTTIRIALGILQPNAGRALICGEDVNRAETRTKVGFLLETDGLYDGLTAAANLHYYAQIYGMKQPDRVIARVLELVNLSDRANDKVGTYSKGMRQRLALARTFLHDPKVLVLDEPTSGVDPTGQIQIRQLILEMAHSEGKTFFLSSHNLDEVQRICNRVALINRGEIKLYGDRDRLQHEAGHGKVIIETLEDIPELVMSQIQSLPGVAIDNRTDRMLTLALNNGLDTSAIITFLMERGVKIEQAKHVETSLEDIYTRILKEVER